MAEQRLRGPILETSRLRGHPIAARHRADLDRIFGDREVTRTLGGLRTPEQIQQIFERFDSHWGTWGWGPWFFCDARERFVGYSGVIETRVEDRDRIELLYALAPEHWNQGFASEMAESVVAHAFGQLGLEELVCFTLTTNRGSQRVMQKAGFRYERDITHATLPHVLYQQSAKEWRQGAKRG